MIKEGIKQLLCVDSIDIKYQIKKIDINSSHILKARIYKKKKKKNNEHVQNDASTKINVDSNRIMNM